MLHRRTRNAARRTISAIALTSLLAAGLLWLARATPSQSGAIVNGHTMTGPSMMMSEQVMRDRMARWSAAHPPHIAGGTSTSAAPVDSFVATNIPLQFNEDGKTATQVDTAHISVGDAVLFKWGAGLHEVASGTGSLDPNVGLLFDVPQTSAADNFSFAFTAVGVYPFFCAIHEAFNMRGVVVVTDRAGSPLPADKPRAGFLRPPWPNPSRSGVACQFALVTAGRARIEVLDAQGRRVSTLIDRDMGPGTSTVSWDGRAQGGGAAPAGIYFIRLSVPGITQTRLVSIDR